MAILNGNSQQQQNDDRMVIVQDTISNNSATSSTATSSSSLIVVVVSNTLSHRQGNRKTTTMNEIIINDNNNNDDDHHLFCNNNNRDDKKSFYDDNKQSKKQQQQQQQQQQRRDNDDWLPCTHHHLFILIIMAVTALFLIVVLWIVVDPSSSFAPLRKFQWIRQRCYITMIDRFTSLTTIASSGSSMNHRRQQQEQRLFLRGGGQPIMFEPTSTYYPSIHQKQEEKRVLQRSGLVPIGQDITDFGRSSLKTAALSGDGTKLAIGEAFGNKVTVWEYNVTSEQWTQYGQVLLGVGFDNFGWSVSLNDNGNYLAVGAQLGDFNGLSQSGYVKVYQYDASMLPAPWVEREVVARFGGPTSGNGGDAANDRLGYSVSISGDGSLLVVSATDGYRPAKNDAAGVPIYSAKVKAGYIRIFGLNQDGQYEYNPAPVRIGLTSGSTIYGRNAEDEIGYSVSISGDGTRVVVGSPLVEPSIGLEENGKVEFYEVDSSGSDSPFITQRGITIFGDNVKDRLGTSVSLNGDGSIAVIGVPLYDSAIGGDSGQVQVWQRTGSDWKQLGSDITGEAAEDEFGSSVSISNDGLTVVVGAPSNAGNAGNGLQAGHIRIYQYDGNDWVLRFISRNNGFEINGFTTNDSFGSAVSISKSGDRAAGVAPGIPGHGSDFYVRVYGTTEYPTFSPIEYPIRVVTDTDSGGCCATRIVKTVGRMFSQTSTYVTNLFATTNITATAAAAAAAASATLEEEGGF